MTATDRLRTLLDGPDLVVVPVVAGPLAARLAQQAGFEAALLGGFGCRRRGSRCPTRG